MDKCNWVAVSDYVSDSVQIEGLYILVFLLFYECQLISVSHSLECQFSFLLSFTLLNLVSVEP